MYWLCSCEQKFDEPGDRTGYGAIMSHLKNASHGNIEGDHKTVGLFDGDDELLVNGLSIKTAIRDGFIEPKPKEPKIANDVEENEGLKTVMRGKAKFIEIDFDYELVMLYRLTREKFNDYDRTFSQWLTECIAAYYNENPELGIDLMYRKLGLIEQEEEEEGVTK